MRAPNVATSPSTHDSLQIKLNSLPRIQGKIIPVSKGEWFMLVNNVNEWEDDSRKACGAEQQRELFNRGFF